MAAVVSGRVAPTETLGARLRRSARAARFNNPYVNGVMAAPPTITATTAQPAGQTNGRRVTDAAVPMRAFGGVPAIYGTVYHRFPVATLNGGSSGGNAVGAQDALSWQLELTADAAKVSFRLLGGTLPHRFLVQGPATGDRLQYVDLAGTLTASSSGTNWITLDFGARALRRIVIEGEAAQAIDGVYVGATETVSETEGTDLLRGVWLTDSFGAAVVGGRINDSFANVMGAALGIRDRRIVAIGSRGWLNDVAGTRHTIGQSMAVDAVPQAPHVGFIFAGINDNASSGAITAEVTTRLKQWRAALTSVPVFVFGAWPGQSGPSAAVLATESAIAAGVAGASDPLALFIPVSTDPSGPWIAGTGRVGATNGSGNSDLYTSTDGVHPPGAGHLYLGLRAADAVMSRLHLLR